MPLGDMPILEIILRQLRYYGFHDIILSVGYMSEIIQAMIGDGSKYGVQVTYLFEDQPLGTAGPLGLIDDLSEDILLINGDTLTTLNYQSLYDYHKISQADITVSTFKREVFIDFGVLELDHDNALINYIEKPTHNFNVSMGVYIISPTVYPFIIRNQRMDIPQLIHKLKDSGRKVICYKEDCFWLDIGRIDDYQKALDIFTEKKEMFLKND